MTEIVKSQLNDEEALKFKPLELQQGESVDEQSSGMEEGLCDFNKHYSSPVIRDLYFTVLGDDDEESSFQSSSTDPDDIIILTKQLKVSSFVFNNENLVEENDDVGLSAPIATQALVPILTPSNFDSELAVDDIDIMKYEFEANFIFDLSSYVKDRLKGTISRVFMNLHPTKWLAVGSNLGYFS
ncbi:unnamed protein product [Vicia faba]|uniref:Uncharacterized protein n=1 Tax=Vicia faba TaxID=3906 RepID=A0AAV0ZPE8_VICFA|nr:unnamed protein product [Vicia faba]